MIETLDALARAFPHPAFLVDPSGQLRWASVEGLRRFELPAAGSAGPAGAGPLEALLRCAVAWLASPTECPDRLLRAAGLVRCDERALARRYQGTGRELVFLELTPAPPEGDRREPAASATRTPGGTAALPQPPAPASAPIPGLSRAEAEVARLAVEGFTVTNISARVGSAESTVRTHLRRVYKKLGVHGRAELAWVLLHGGRGSSSGR